MSTHQTMRVFVMLMFAIGSPLIAQNAPTPSAAPAARIKLGIDVLERDGFKPLVGKRVGLITNPSGLAADMRSTIDVLSAAPGVKLTALFGPEHGVRGEAAAGSKVDDAHDSATGLPVYSLYGKTRKPTPEMLKDVDVLVFDIQDIGSRSYTFISTLAVAMEAAAENGKQFVVLDRPNPINGNRIEGRVLDPAFRSFVGLLEVPYCHGMTVGELAQMINGEGWLGHLGSPPPPEADHVATGADAAKTLKCDLTVIPMEGWKRDMYWEQTGLLWTPTSPHIPRSDTSLFYAATGIVGETNGLSVGVGYTLPFELVGAPGIDARTFADELNGRKLPGVRFRPVYYTPFYARHKDKVCGGAQIILTDRDQADLTAIQFHVLDATRKLYPDMQLFDDKRDAMFSKVCGTDGVRKLFAEKRPIDDVLAFWRAGVDDFRAKRAKYLLYH